MKKVIFFIIILLLNLTTYGCNVSDINDYKTFVLNEGAVHFSIEYRNLYKLDYLKSAEISGDLGQTSMTFVLAGPVDRATNDYTSIHIGADKPDHIVADAKSAVERAERNGSSWADYALLEKGEFIFAGVPAYRIDYQIRNIVPAIAGVSDKRFISVYREVRFDAKGYVWMIQIRSDSSTAEADKVDFEHVLQTFKILD